MTSRWQEEAQRLFEKKVAGQVHLELNKQQFIEVLQEWCEMFAVKLSFRECELLYTELDQVKVGYKKFHAFLCHFSYYKLEMLTFPKVDDDVAIFNAAKESKQFENMHQKEALSKVDEKMQKYVGEIIDEQDRHLWKPYYSLISFCLVTKSKIFSLINSKKSQNDDKWVVFILGPKATGKTNALIYLDEVGILPCEYFVSIDSRKVQRLLKSDIKEEVEMKKISNIICNVAQAFAMSFNRNHILRISNYSEFAGGGINTVRQRISLFKDLNSMYKYAVIHIMPKSETSSNKTELRESAIDYYHSLSLQKNEHRSLLSVNVLLETNKFDEKPELISVENTSGR